MLKTAPGKKKKEEKDLPAFIPRLATIMRLTNQTSIS